MTVYFQNLSYRGQPRRVPTVLFSDIEWATRLKQTWIEQRGYFASDIRITSADKDGKLLEA